MKIIHTSYPASLSLHGKLRIGKKSDLVECMDNLCKTSEEAPSAVVIIMDGAFVETNCGEEIPRMFCY